MKASTKVCYLIRILFPDGVFQSPLTVWNNALLRYREICIFTIYVISTFKKCVPSPWYPSSAGLSVSGWGPCLRDPLQHRRDLHSLCPAPPEQNRFSFVQCTCVLSCLIPAGPTGHCWPRERDLGTSLAADSCPVTKTGYCVCTRAHSRAPCCPGETGATLPASRRCSPRRSSCHG